jgi:D-tyrosyl-tRNA(Tyr) deacylase
MILLVERVREARVSSAGETLGVIGPGLLVQVAFLRGDSPKLLPEAARRLLALRIFPDERGRLVRGCIEAGRGVLLVPAFVLAAEAATGGRLDFAAAEAPASARGLFECLLAALEERCPGRVAHGRFGAAMTIYAEHDGPVPFVLRLVEKAPSPAGGVK